VARFLPQQPLVRFAKIGGKAMVDDNYQEMLAATKKYVLDNDKDITALCDEIGKVIDNKNLVLGTTALQLVLSHLLAGFEEEDKMSVIRVTILLMSAALDHDEGNFGFIATKGLH
jgi:hypothetical protein